MVYNKGYIGKGKYNRKEHIQIYRIWHNILQRCYGEKYVKKYATYKDCEICDEWLDFQNFAQWYDQNLYRIPNERMCLDKDILFKHNKLYSPYTCCFVPNHINMLFTKVDKKRGEYPIGVYLDKKTGLYCTKYKSNGKDIYLGLYDTPEKAFYVYKTNKELEIKRVADQYKQYLPRNVYDALMNYKVEIYD